MEKRVNVWTQRRADRPALDLQWLDPATGRRKSRSAKTDDPEEAERRRADLEYELNHGLYAQPGRIAWAQFRELFDREYATNCKPATRKCFANVFNLFERLCAPRLLRSVNERTISSFAAALRREPGRGKGATMRPLTVKIRLQFLRVALRWAADQKLLAACPDFPAIKVPKRKPQPVPQEAFDRLLAKAGDDRQMRAFLLCGWLAGLRRSEALALEREATDAAPWIDRARRRIVLPAAFVKAGEDQWVPLDPELGAALGAVPGSGARVFNFLNHITGRPLTPESASRLVVKLSKAAGVRLTMHALRRGFGCRYAARVPAQVLQKLMRHSDIHITMDYYANVDEAVEEAVLGPACSNHRSRPRDGDSGGAGVEGAKAETATASGERR